MSDSSMFPLNAGDELQGSFSLVCRLSVLLLHVPFISSSLFNLTHKPLPPPLIPYLVLPLFYPPPLVSCGAFESSPTSFVTSSSSPPVLFLAVADTLRHRRQTGVLRLSCLWPVTCGDFAGRPRCRLCFGDAVTSDPSSSSVAMKEVKLEGFPSPVSLCAQRGVSLQQTAPVGVERWCSGRPLVTRHPFDATDHILSGAAFWFEELLHHNRSRDVKN
ncbi:unnamed protein product [Pleuronectes platessa]|uniref:Uncharacterized protein n=1 Tax=Pleuronectes platessa TaxID=8262 RepID=A0A9N7UB21_PLEPL|nr:unnamed protein product [Pleuronectes platessa]